MPARNRSCSTAQTPPDDQDSPWKEALELYFRPAMALLAPELHALVDWRTGVQYLDKELQSIARLSKRGHRFVDKLVSVKLLDGDDLWLLVHVEVQGRMNRPDDLHGFAQRMFEYNTLIGLRASRAHLGEEPTLTYSLGILTDGHDAENQLSHHHGFLHQALSFTFPVIHLEAWRGRADELETLALSNPFAIIVMAQLEANQHPDKATRLQPKLDLVRRLKHYGYSSAEAGQLYRLIDWMITLPEDLEPVFLDALSTLSEEETMTYVTTAERWGIKKGIAQGMTQGLEKGVRNGQAELLLRQIQRRFGPVTANITERVNAATTPQIELWALNFVGAATLDDVFRE